MYKLNKKKGFTLIEVLCSITLYAILFMITLTMGVKVFEIQKYNKKINNYFVVMEGIKNTMIYNATYDEIKKLNSEYRYYMPIENIDFDELREKGVTNMFVETKPLKDSYVVISVEDGNVLRVNLRLYTRINNNTNTMECEFYKGKYKR